MKESKEPVYCMVRTNKKGRCAVASKLIRSGSIVLIDVPLACVPLTSPSISSSIFKKFPHSPIELSFLSEARRRGFDDFKAVLLAARVLRILHSSNQQTVIDNYNSLSTGCSDLLSRDYLDNLSASASMVQRLLFPLEIGLDKCKEVLLKLSNNAFTITSSSLDIIGYGLYLHASIFNHSCQPNVIQTYEEEKIVMKAVRDIHPGEEIIVSYIDLALPRYARQLELLPYGFHCDCMRCSLVEVVEIRCSKCFGSMRPPGHYYHNVFKQWIDMKILASHTFTSKSKYTQYQKLGLPYSSCLEQGELVCSQCTLALSSAKLSEQYDNLLNTIKFAEDFAAKLSRESMSRENQDRVLTRLRKYINFIPSSYVQYKVLELVLELSSYCMKSIANQSKQLLFENIQQYFKEYEMFIGCKYVLYKLPGNIHPTVLQSYLLYLDLILYYYEEYRFFLPALVHKHRRVLKGLSAVVKSNYGENGEALKKVRQYEMELNHLPC